MPTWISNIAKKKMHVKRHVRKILLTWDDMYPWKSGTWHDTWIKTPKAFLGLIPKSSQASKSNLKIIMIPPPEPFNKLGVAKMYQLKKINELYYMHIIAHVACSHWLIIATTWDQSSWWGLLYPTPVCLSAVEYSITQKIYYMCTFQKEMSPSGTLWGKFLAPRNPPRDRSPQYQSNCIISISISISSSMCHCHSEHSELYWLLNF